MQRTFKRYALVFIGSSVLWLALVLGFVPGTSTPNAEAASKEYAYGVVMPKHSRPLEPGEDGKELKWRSGKSFETTLRHFREKLRGEGMVFHRTLIHKGSMVANITNPFPTGSWVSINIIHLRGKGDQALIHFRARGTK